MDIKNSVKETFIVKYSADPLLIQSPGRINLIGGHTDYNNGYVMPAAIGKAMYFALGKEGNSILEIYSKSYDDFQVVKVLQTAESPFWLKYFTTILEILAERGYVIKGLQCVFDSDIPIGAGLSSSAALCAGFLHGLSEMFDLKLERPDIARIAQQTEHRIGLNCGLMDQYGVLFGKRNQVFCLDCQTYELEYLPLNLGNYTLALFNSNINHQLATDSEYNRRRTSCENVVTKLSELTGQTFSTLRDIEMEIFLKYKNELDPIDFKRANYIFSENQRVQKMKLALMENNLEEAGKLLLQAQNGYSKEYEVSLPEIDYLIQIAMEHDNILGGRLMGGGFGGATLNIVAKENMEQTFEEMKKKYFARTGINCTVEEIEVGDGVCIIN